MSVLIQILLPVVGDKGLAAGDSRLADTARELGDVFGGLTAYVRSPARGLWTAPTGRTDEDDVVMVEVVTERFDRTWWKEYSTMLANRFSQDAIHVRALPVELLDPAAS
jgi:hypothetical protein